MVQRIRVEVVLTEVEGVGHQLVEVGIRLAVIAHGASLTDLHKPRRTQLGEVL